MLQLFLYISHQLLNFCLDFLSNSKNAQKFKCCRKPCWSMTYLGLSFLKSLRIFNFFQSSSVFIWISGLRFNFKASPVFPALPASSSVISAADLSTAAAASTAASETTSSGMSSRASLFLFVYISMTSVVKDHYWVYKTSCRFLSQSVQV